MTVLLSLRRGDGTFHREFIDLERVEVGECVRTAGTTARVIDVIRQTVPFDLDRYEYELPPSLDFDAELLAEPIAAKFDQDAKQMRFDFAGGAR